MDWSSASENKNSFSLQERDRRWARVREEMAAQRVDVLLALPEWLNEDALYLANQIGVVILPLASEPTLLIGGEGSNRSIGREGWITDRRSATARGSTKVPYGQATVDRLREMNIRNERIGICGLSGSDVILVRQPEGYVNYSSVRKLEQAFPEATFVDATPIMAAVRHMKSEEEIDLIRDAVSIAEAGARALAEFARPGVLQAEVFAQIVLAQLRRGSAGGMLSWCGGPWGEHKWRYTTPPPGAIEPRWYVGTEIGPTLRGYNCQVSEPIVVGPLDEQASAIWELGKEAFHRLCELMRPDKTWGEVEDGVKAIGRGTSYSIEFLIHGRGLGAEGPMLIPVDTHDHVRNVRVVENSVFIVKPYAYPSEGKYAHVTRSHDVTWGDTVVVRKDGAKRLGTRPHELVQIG